jgi:uncharacterized protein YjaG (DUF416 family)
MADIGTFQAFLDGLESQLARMPQLYQLAFGGACCERAFPNYIAFSKAEHWGDPRIVRKALDMVWDIIAGAKVEQARIKDLEKQCYAVTPDSDDFGSVLDTAGQEASIAIQWLLRYCLEADPKCGLRISRLQRDTIYGFVQDEMELDPMDPTLDATIDAHPLMRQELQRQKEDLAHLQQAVDLSEFCRRARKIEKSNIGLPSESVG